MSALPISDQPDCPEEGNGGNIRPASHAGTWYVADGPVLAAQIDCWTKAAEDTVAKCLDAGGHGSRVRAVIVPHAGYRYSGKTAASAYQAIKVSGPYARALLLYPSHYPNPMSGRLGLCSCPFRGLETPLGPLRTRSISGVGVGDRAGDVREHSGEMQFPFIRRSDIALVSPIMVGPHWTEQEVGLIRAMLQRHPETVVIISSDFCHYGPHYSFQPQFAADRERKRRQSAGSVSHAIRDMDMAGFRTIQSKDPRQFRRYLAETGNTICGQEPIAFAMRLLQDAPGEWQLLAYDQSNPDCPPTGNSVSYLAAGFFEKRAHEQGLQDEPISNSKISRRQ